MHSIVVANAIGQLVIRLSVELATLHTVLLIALLYLELAILNIILLIAVFKSVTTISDGLNLSLIRLLILG